MPFTKTKVKKRSDVLYTFVFKNGGWWLLCKDIETLANFHKVTDGVIFGDALKLYWEHTDKPGHSRYARSASLEKVIELQAEKNHESFFNAAQSIHFNLFNQQAQAIKESGGIYINSVGGYHRKESKPVNYTYCHSEKLVWPKLTEKDIRVSKFEGGQHYYAKVGNVEVRDENGIKWDSYEQAYKKALELLN